MQLFLNFGAIPTPLKASCDRLANTWIACCFQRVGVTILEADRQRKANGRFPLSLCVCVWNKHWSKTFRVIENVWWSLKRLREQQGGVVLVSSVFTPRIRGKIRPFVMSYLFYLVYIALKAVHQIVTMTWVKARTPFTHSFSKMFPRAQCVVMLLLLMMMMMMQHIYKHLYRCVICELVFSGGILEFGKFVSTELQQNCHTPLHTHIYHNIHTDIT